MRDLETREGGNVPWTTNPFYAYEASAGSIGGGSARAALCTPLAPDERGGISEQLFRFLRAASSSSHPSRYCLSFLAFIAFISPSENNVVQSVADRVPPRVHPSPDGYPSSSRWGKKKKKGDRWMENLIGTTYRWLALYAVFIVERGRNLLLSGSGNAFRAKISRSNDSSSEGRGEERIRGGRRG